MESLPINPSNNNDSNNKTETNEKIETTDTQKKENIANDLEKDEYFLFTEEIKDFFFIQIESLFEYFIKGKNKFNLQNDSIDKNQIKSILPESIQSQLEIMKQYSRKTKLLSPCEIYIKLKSDLEFQVHKNESDNCPICMENFYEIDLENEDLKFTEILKKDKKLKLAYNVLMLDECQDHYFHLECLVNLKGKNDFIKCPICFKIYGIQKGEQPEGTMIAYIDKAIKCASYENCDTIVIFYDFPSGAGYTGTRRQAFLPANDKGWEILGLLKECFDRKLVFKVGTSVTTGKSNTVVWSGIHHKSNISGGIFHSNLNFCFFAFYIFFILCFYI